MKNESPLLKSIAKDFAATGDFSSVVDLFCDFAADWLHQKGLVGLGHSSDGMALRFSNGDEQTLLRRTNVNSDLPSVQLTGNVEKLAVNQPDNDRSSFQITGR